MTYFFKIKVYAQRVIFIQNVKSGLACHSFFFSECDRVPILVRCVGWSEGGESQHWTWASGRHVSEPPERHHLPGTSYRYVLSASA